MTASGPGSEQDRPNVARVYDWLLGGSHNFAADREFGERFRAIWPGAPETMRANRAFLGRAVKHLAGQAGIGQFLDIGSGIPTMGNVHEVARAASPRARVVYVDNDAVAVQHSRALLARDDRAVAIQADLRWPRDLLAHPDLRAMLDLSQPVAVCLVAVLHFVPGTDDAAALVAGLRNALAPGSYMVISHGTADGQPAQVSEAMAVYGQVTAPFRLRSRAEIMRFFAGFELIEPGLVPIPQWRPDDPVAAAEQAGRIAGYAGIGRKPR